MNDDKRKNREIMDGDWIFTNKGRNPDKLQNEVQEMYKEDNDPNPNKRVAVQVQDQAEFLKECGIPVSVFPNLPETIEFICTTTISESPKRKHTCRSKRIYCSQTDAWINDRYIENLLKRRKKLL
ncbi:hypothetical protein AVEN_84822-1 [Araneus ventricosus]|uniref:Uncharacterized protein n=1 Tax=Araneus ventricosus TaxID=182803 RepID=A0A4Y2IX20_ARAVE|nr:hypothetical protein AVEN_84822-1 [Araneus ventricosus]